MRLLSSLAALAALTATAVNAAHNLTVYNNDTSVSYTGLSWSPYTNCGGTKYTYSTGQFFSFTFTGVGIYIVGTASLEGGIIGINLDGEAQPSFDRYALPPYRCGVPWFGKSGLANQTHTITVTLLGNSPENSTEAGFIEWQWLLYTQLDASDVATTSAAATTTTGSAYSSSIIPTTTASNDHNGTKSSNGAAIGGGITGGIIGAAIIGFLIWFFCFRKKDPEAAQGRRTSLDPGPAMAPPPARADYRTSMSMLPGATAWTPDATTAANLGPQGGYPGGPVAAPPPPLMHQSNSSYARYDPMERSPGVEAPLLPQHYSSASGPGSSGGPASVSGTGTNTTNTGLYTTNPSDQPSSPYGPKYNRYSPPSSAVGPGSSVSQQGMADQDVDRIAQRVASMMAAQGGGAPAGPSHYPAMADEDAPPMYHESGPNRPAPPEKSGF